MKIKSLFFASALLAGLTLASCSKDSDGDTNPNLPGEEENTEVEAGLPTYATFAITLANANEGTRAFLGDLRPTASESTVDQLTVYIYDVFTGKIEDVLTFSDENDSKTTLVTTGPKKFLATSGMNPVFTVGDTPDIENQEISVLGETYFDANLTQSNKFWMTSNIVEHVVVSATQAEAETAGHHNYIVIGLGRAMAKIGVYYDLTINVTDGATPTPLVLGTMSDVMYKVKNQPNKMYAFTGKDNSGVWRTPYFNRNNSLWADSHANDYWHQSNWSKTTLVSNEHEEPTYMMENSNMVARYGNATYVSIEGVFTPAKWLDENGNDVTGTIPPSAGDDFWRIAKVTFEADGTTVKEITGWLNNDIYQEEPLNTWYDDTKEAPIKYAGGKVYYWIYLNSTLGQATPTNTENKYSQQRNQYWDVQIEKVTGLGWNEEDGGKNPDPDPLDNDSYIHATIQVLNWEGVSMPGELVGNN